MPCRTSSSASAASRTDMPVTPITRSIARRRATGSPSRRGPRGSTTPDRDVEAEHVLRGQAAGGERGDQGADGAARSDDERATPRQDSPARMEDGLDRRQDRGRDLPGLLFDLQPRGGNRVRGSHEPPPRSRRPPADRTRCACARPSRRAVRPRRRGSGRSASARRRPGAVLGGERAERRAVGGAAGEEWHQVGAVLDHEEAPRALELEGEEAHGERRHGVEVASRVRRAAAPPAAPGRSAARAAGSGRSVPRSRPAPARSGA